MSRISENTDILRALGRLLDDQGATTFEIMNHQTFLSMSWDQLVQGAERRSYQEHQLNDLRREARGMRQAGEGPVGSLVELLRTIGQELDREHVELSGIVRDAESFRVSGVAGGKHFSARYSTRGLVALAAERRATRGRARPVEAKAVLTKESDSFVGVMVGSPVYSEDNEHLGTVKEIRARSFFVAGGLFKAGHWLPAESVASIGREGEVFLRPVGS